MQPDVEIGAHVKARKLRFKRKPKTKVEFEGTTRVRPDVEKEIEEIDIESDSWSDRRNLPDEVEPGVTYRNVEVGWVAGARAVMPDDEEDEDEQKQ